MRDRPHDAVSKPVAGSVATASGRHARSAPSNPGRTTTRAAGTAGATLILEAVNLIEARRWGHAISVLESARRLRPDDPAIDELVVIAAAHGHRRRALDGALTRINARSELSVSAYHALAVRALVGRKYHVADDLARKAIDLDPDSGAAWTDLATAFAGLGWFDQATECLLVAADSGGVTGIQQWRLGQAVNHWALTRTPALAVTALATVLVGLLALAFGLSVPVLLREVRVNALPEPFKGAAQWQWRNEHLIKIVFGVGVLISVIGFVASVMYQLT